MTKMEEEILQQKTVLKRCFEKNYDNAKFLAQKIADSSVSHVYIAARGSSLNACLYFKYLFEIMGGKPVIFFNPSVITKYGAYHDFSSSVVIGVSQSGQGADINAVLSHAKCGGAFTAAITNFENSSIAEISDITLNLFVGEELSVAATKTMTAEMLVLKMICDFYKRNDTDFSDVFSSVAFAIDNFSYADKIAKFLSDKREVIVLSRGLSLAVAHEIALKLQETSYINARPFAISDFYHGPFALVEKDMTFLLISSDEKTREDCMEILEKLQIQGAKVIAISNDDNINKAADFCFPIGTASPTTSPIGAVVAGQIIALKTALIKGLNPDAPRGLKKITITK